MRWQQKHAVLWLALGFGVARNADGQEIRTTFRVRYVASEAVYLDGGRAAGLSEGYRLTVKRRQPGEAEMEAKDVGEIVVVSLAEHSAVCEIKSHEMQFQVDDVAYLSNQDADTARMLNSSNRIGRAHV